MYEIFVDKGYEKEDAKEITDILAKYEKVFIDFMMAEELGLMPIEENPLRSSVTTFISFLIFGFFPILPYVIAYGINVKGD